MQRALLSRSLVTYQHLSRHRYWEQHCDGSCGEVNFQMHFCMKKVFIMSYFWTHLIKKTKYPVNYSFMQQLIILSIKQGKEKHLPKETEDQAKCLSDSGNSNHNTRTNKRFPINNWSFDRSQHEELGGRGKTHGPFLHFIFSVFLFLTLIYFVFHWWEEKTFWMPIKLNKCMSAVVWTPWGF